MTDTSAAGPLPTDQPVNPVIQHFLETGELTDEMSALMATDAVAYRAVYDATYRNLSALAEFGRRVRQARADRAAAAPEK
jgi:hypothetical protein